MQLPFGAPSVVHSVMGIQWIPATRLEGPGHAPPEAAGSSKLLVMQQDPLPKKRKSNFHSSVNIQFHSFVWLLGLTSFF